jgi:H+-transporting ATPase
MPIQSNLDTARVPQATDVASSQVELDTKEQFVTAAPTERKSWSDQGENSEDAEDIDALIDELESLDGHIDLSDSGQDDGSKSHCVSEELLQTDSNTGLTEAEVLLRRKKYGLNQMREEKENLFLKFLSYFVGPVQFVMEVCTSCPAISGIFSYKILDALRV